MINTNQVVSVFRKVKQKMNIAEFKAWLEKFGEEMYKLGATEERQRLLAEYEKCTYEVDEDEFYKDLLEVPGVGEKTAGKIMKKMRTKIKEGE